MQRHRADLEQRARRHQRRAGLSLEAQRGERRAKRAGVGVVQRQAEKEQRAAERPGEEVLDRRFEAQSSVALARARDEQVGGQGHELEADEEHDQVARDREQAHAEHRAQEQRGLDVVAGGQERERQRSREDHQQPAQTLHVHGDERRQNPRQGGLQQPQRRERRRERQRAHEQGGRPAQEAQAEGAQHAGGERGLRREDVHRISPRIEGSISASQPAGASPIQSIRPHSAHRIDFSRKVRSNTRLLTEPSPRGAQKTA